jgi:hypothetical protein
MEREQKQKAAIIKGQRERKARRAGGQQNWTVCSSTGQGDPRAARLLLSVMCCEAKRRCHHFSKQRGS